jgi:hypothetical protein
MIHIFFVPGMFGSMLEMALRAFTNLDGTLQPRFAADGSSHTFRKQYHPLALQSILYDVKAKISTPIYPWRDSSLKSILEQFECKMPNWHQDQKVLIHASDIKWAEINLLFQYHKISIGLGRGLDIFGGECNNLNITNWNPQYKDFQQMARWEWREWFSIFYPVYVQEWIDSPKEVSRDFLILTNQQILESTEDTLLRLIEFCGLTRIKPIEDFIPEYQRGQTYIVKEYNRINDIIDSVTHNKSLSWESLSIVGEAILQNRFRNAGFEWYCDGLDVLPTNSMDFQNILYQSTGDLHA